MQLQNLCPHLAVSFWSLCYFTIVISAFHIVISACDHEDASHCLSCNSAVDILVDAFTTSVQIFLGGEEHEPLLQHHRRFSTQGNLLKGVSKVTIIEHILGC